MIEHQAAGCAVSGTTLISTVRPVCRTPFGSGMPVSAQALAVIGIKHTGYRIKPYGQLVSVSSTHYCAYTPDLSTSWS